MKRAVSSMDAWGVREGAAAGDRRVVRLKRCKSAFANLKRLGTIAANTSPTAAGNTSSSNAGGAASIFASEGMKRSSSLGLKESPVPQPQWHFFREPSQGSTSTMSRGSQQKINRCGPDEVDGDCGPTFSFGSTPWASPESAARGGGEGGGHQQQHTLSVPAGVATSTERRLMFNSSGGSNSSPSLIPGESCTSSGGGRARIGRGFSSQHRYSYSSSSTSKCSTVHEQQCHNITTTTTTSMLSPACASSSGLRCPFLQLERQQQQQQDGFAGWITDPSEERESSSDFSIVGFDDLDEDGGAMYGEGEAVGTSEEEEEEEEEEEGTGCFGSSSNVRYETSNSNLPSSNISPNTSSDGLANRHHQPQQQQNQTGVVDTREDRQEEQEGETGSDSSPLLLLRLQRRLEGMLLVSNVAT